MLARALAQAASPAQSGASSAGDSAHGGPMACTSVGEPLAALR